MRIRVAILVAVLLAATAGVVVSTRSRAQPARALAAAPSTTVASTTTTSTTLEPVVLAPGAPSDPVGVAAEAAIPTPIAPCDASRVLILVATAAPVVLPGQPVDTVVRQRNDGDQPCRWPGDVRFTWSDATGSRFELARSDVQPESVRWEPGQVLEQRASWDQRFANGTVAAVGEANVTVSWGPAREPANTTVAPFTIVAGLPTAAPA